MNEKIVNQILGYLDNLGKAISSGAKESFAIIVKQQFAIGIVDTMICGIVLLLAIIGAILLVKCAIKIDDWEDASGWLVLMAILCGVCAFIDLFCLARSILHILNPEFFAIQYILNTITGNN